ncbi:MAG: radical SAM protein [Bacteroidia bacterium]|nr:radical SAM protein [Bacteroidia bacterium]
MNSSETILTLFKTEYHNYSIRDKEYCPEITPVNRKIISGFFKELAHFRLKISLIQIALTCYNKPKDWINAFRYLVQVRRKYLSDNRIKKMVQFEGKYYMGLYTPGWNSQIYKTFIATHLNDFKPVKNLQVNRFDSVFLGITKKCNYRCDHCYEWERLNKKDILTTKRLKVIIDRIQNLGVSQIHLSGGEPMLKINTILNLLNYAGKNMTHFWIDTSGYNLNFNNAKKLKASGLTGVVVSLDHHEPDIHNAFRHHDDAYFWVEEAIKNANQNNLLTALSICLTQDFVTDENLLKYMNLAKKLNVSFVQFLEPKSVGHFKNKNIKLQKEQILILEKFFLKVNFDKQFNSYPIITYHGYYQRRHGCLSAGKKSMYIDTEGNLNLCPFCHEKTGNILDDSFNDHISKLMERGCHAYQN